MPAVDISGLILCGGRGTRMGTVDKGLLLFDGLPLIDHAVTRLRPQVNSLSINANQNVSIYQKWGLPVLEDEIEGFAGPLAGIHAGMKHCTTPWLVTVPCDSPFLPPDLVDRLQLFQANTCADIAVPVTGEGATRQLHSAFCLVRAELVDDLFIYLAKGGRKVQAWQRLLNIVEVPFDYAHAFRNINTPNQLAALEPPPRK